MSELAYARKEVALEDYRSLLESAPDRSLEVEETTEYEELLLSGSSTEPVLRDDLLTLGFRPLTTSTTTLKYGSPLYQAIIGETTVSSETWVRDDGLIFEMKRDTTDEYFASVYLSNGTGTSVWPDDDVAPYRHERREVVPTTGDLYQDVAYLESFLENAQKQGLRALLIYDVETHELRNEVHRAYLQADLRGSLSREFEEQLLKADEDGRRQSRWLRVSLVAIVILASVISQSWMVLGLGFMALGLLEFTVTLLWRRFIPTPKLDAIGEWHTAMNNEET